MPGKLVGDFALTTVNYGSGAVATMGLMEWTIDTVTKMLDATTTDGSGAEFSLASNVGWTAKAKFAYIDGDESQITNILSALQIQTGSPTWTFFVTNETGTAPFQGEAYIDGITLNSGVGKLVAADVSLKGNGFLTQLVPAIGGTAATVVVAEPAYGEPRSTALTVSVNGSSAPVYLAKVQSLINPSVSENPVTGGAEYGTANLASFAFGGGPVTVTMNVTGETVTSAIVKPFSAGVTASYTASTVTFSLSNPGNYTVEINGDWLNSTHIFANPLEVSPPSPTDPNVLYYAPGVYHVGAINLASGQTLYVADGAILYINTGGSGSCVTMSPGSFVRGRGIIDGSLNVAHTDVLHTHTGTGYTMEDVILRGGTGFHVHPFQATNVTISNLKIIGWLLNADGIDPDGATNVAITGCFIRVFDDCISVKADNTLGYTTNNVNVSGCVLWNSIAHALCVGTEVVQNVSNVTFSNCDIIRDKGRNQALTIWNNYQGTASNITWSNIRLEEVQSLIGLLMTPTGTPGAIASVAFHNISAPAQSDTAEPLITISGYGASNGVNTVALQNVVVGGVPLTLGQVTIGSYAAAVSVTP